VPDEPAFDADGVLTVFIPDRQRPGALAAAFARHGLQLLVGWPGDALRGRYADRRGLCVIVTGFSPQTAAKGRHVLPENVARALVELLEDTRASVEFALLAGMDDAPKHARLTADALTGPLVAGCRYHIEPPPPRPRPVPGRPEVEGWTRRGT